MSTSFIQFVTQDRKKSASAQEVGSVIGGGLGAGIGSAIGMSGGATLTSKLLGSLGAGKVRSKPMQFLLRALGLGGAGIGAAATGVLGGGIGAGLGSIAGGMKSATGLARVAGRGVGTGLRWLRGAGKSIWGKMLPSVGVGGAGYFLGNRQGYNSGMDEGQQYGFGAGMNYASNQFGEAPFWTRLFSPSSAIEPQMQQHYQQLQNSGLLKKQASLIPGDAGGGEHAMAAGGTGLGALGGMKGLAALLRGGAKERLGRVALPFSTTPTMFAAKPGFDPQKSQALARSFFRNHGTRNSILNTLRTRASGGLKAVAGTAKLPMALAALLGGGAGNLLGGGAGRAIFGAEKPPVAPKQASALIKFLQRAGKLGVKAPGAPRLGNVVKWSAEPTNMATLPTSPIKALVDTAMKTKSGNVLTPEIYDGPIPQNMRNVTPKSNMWRSILGALGKGAGRLGSLWKGMSLPAKLTGLGTGGLLSAGALTEKRQPTLPPEMQKLAFGTWLGKALPYAGRWLGSIPGRIGRGAQIGAGAIGKMLGGGHGATQLSRAGRAGWGNISKNLAGHRAGVSTAFKALSPGMQNTLRVGQFAAGLAPSVAMNAGSYAGGMQDGARKALGGVADQFDQLGNAGFLDRSRLALGLAFKPDMLKQLSQQIRTAV